MTGLIEGYLVKKFGEKVGPRVLTIGGILVVILILAAIIFGVRSCYVRKQITKTDAELQQLEKNSAEATAEVKSLEQQLGPTDDRVIEAKEREKEALKKEAVAKQRDSSTHDSDKQKVMQRFCAKFPADSLCN